MKIDLKHKSPLGRTTCVTHTAYNVLEKQLDFAALEASSRLLLDNDMPSNKALQFSEYLEKNSFKTIRMTPIIDPNNAESMEMDT